MKPLQGQPAKPGNRHILALDGLRALAITAVIIAHTNLLFGGAFPTGSLNGALAGLFGCSWAGVDLFFVLSGFLITGILCDAKGSDQFLRNFYMRRTLRIMPLYFGVLVSVSILTRAVPKLLIHPPSSTADMISLVAFYYNFRTAFVTKTGTLYFHHFWSLNVEEHFYLLWPLLIIMLPRKHLLKVCICGIIASLLCRIAVILSGSWPQIAYLITPCRLDGLLAGAFIALAIRDEETWLRVRPRIPSIMIGSACLILGLFLGQRNFAEVADVRGVPGPLVDNSFTLTIGITALSLFFAGLLSIVIEAPPTSKFRRFLESPWLVSIGFYSYAIYVFHVIVIVQIYRILEHVAPWFLKWPGYLAKPLFAILLLLASYATAFASYHLYEKHFLSLKRYFGYRTSVRARPLAEPAPSEFRSDFEVNPET